MGDAVPRRAEVGDELADALERRLERGEAGELAADMDRDAAQVEPRQRRQPGEDFGRAVDADAELVFGLAGRNLRMRARIDVGIDAQHGGRSEEHTSELQSLMRLSYAVFCLKKKKNPYTSIYNTT